MKAREQPFGKRLSSKTRTSHQFCERRHVKHFVGRVGKSFPRRPSTGNLSAIGTIVKRFWIILFLFAFGFCTFAEEKSVEADEFLRQVRETLQENEALLDVLGIDGQEVERFVVELNTRFSGTYVYDLGALRQTATQLIPILQQFEETSDYAAWLQSRLDYFEVAEQLQKQASTQTTNKARLPDPSPQVERKAWVTVVEKRPMPPEAEQYVPGLKKVFVSEKVPAELVWIAEVESSFNVKAKSPVGAAGLFQLMPATARNLDLSTGVLGVGDERLNPEKSGRAAARYLHQLKDRFGDWRLALAAYNAGEGRVGELLKKHKGGGYEHIAHRLPAETQMYVPKVEAIIRKREGVSLNELKMPRG